MGATEIWPMDVTSIVDFGPETIVTEGEPWVMVEPIVAVVHEPDMITVGQATRVMEQRQPAIELEEEEVKSQEQVGSAQQTSVQATANGFDEATLKTIPELSKPHLPHESLSWVRFMTFCGGELAKGPLFCCGEAEKLPALRRLDNSLEHAAFCCEESAKPPAVCETDNTIILWSLH